jgi:hypothetical protein
MADTTVPQEAIPHLLRAGDLPVPSERHGMIAEQLSALFDDANELNRKMARMRDVSPAVRFHHPETQAEEE